MLRGNLLSTIATLLLFASIGCSSGNDDDDRTIMKPKADTGVADTGVTNNDDGGMGMDAAVVDAGPMVCNPIDGSGCPTGEFCVFVSSTNMAQCRTLPAAGMRAQHEMTCNELQQDCEPGFACFNSGTGPVCHQVCSQANQTVCANVQGMANDYFCSFFQDNTGQPLDYGFCLGGDGCNPALKAAACGMNETCSLQGTNPVCLMSGTTPVGGDCSMNNCLPGGICINLNGTAGPTCYEGCDMANPCTSGTAACGLLQGFSWGICQEVTACDPLADTCPNTQYCQLNGNTTQCVPEGPNTNGQPCSGASLCMRGGMCIDVGMGATCSEPCDPMNDMCSMGTCNGLQGLTWGICQ